MISQQELLHLIDNDIDYYGERLDALVNIKRLVFTTTITDKTEDKIIEFYTHQLRKYVALIAFRKQVADWPADYLKEGYHDGRKY